MARASTLTDLCAYLDLLRREGEIVAIDAEVDPHLEAAEIHRRVIAANGPALLFRGMKGSPFPAVTNLFGSARRVEPAFGVRPRRLPVLTTWKKDGGPFPSLGLVYTEHPQGRRRNPKAMAIPAERVRRCRPFDSKTSRAGG